jgi:hypothetical protein
VRLLDAIKSFREGYSLRETMKKCVKVVFVYKQPFDNHLTNGKNNLLDLAL